MGQDPDHRVTWVTPTMVVEVLPAPVVGQVYHGDTSTLSCSASHTMYHVTFLSKTYGPMIQPPVMAKVDLLRYEAPGGPSEAQATITGDTRDLVALANLLRNPVQIWDDHGEVVWWGIWRVCA